MLRRALAALILAAIVIISLIGAPVAAQTNTSKARLDSISAQLQQIEATLQRRDLNDQQLTGVRTGVEPLADELRTIIANEAPRLDGVKSRLEQLGPAPDAKAGTPENTDVSTERDTQEKLRKDLDDTLRIARFQNEKAGQIVADVANRRRALFAHALLERSAPLISPVIWLDLIRQGPAELQHVAGLLKDWWMTALEHLDLTRALIVAFFAFVLAAGAPRLLRFIYSLEGRSMDAHEPTRLARATMALRVSIGAAVVPAIACAGAYALFDALDLLPDRVAGVLRAFLIGIAFTFFVRAIAMGVIPITKPAWRVFPVSTLLATRLQLLVFVVALVFTIGKTLEALSQAIVSPLSISILVRGLTAVAIAGSIMWLMRSFKDEDDKQKKDEEDCLGPQVPPPAEKSNWLRVIGWLVTSIIIVAAASGYIALAAFLSEQIIWIGVVLVFATLLSIIIDEAIGKGLSSEGKLGRQMRSAVGLKSGSVDQISILSSGVLKLVLIVIAFFMILAPWGVDSSDLTGYVKAGFFGFSVAGVTISISTIAGAILIFVLGITATRSLQRWLDMRYLPHTGLDIGLRNSIKTIFGYVGVLIAAALAFSQAGLSLDKLTIVAGALSVGIGFGLQSIVNNFVSGLILLWERPLRVGDQIVVGTEEGIVRRINVRATEIETFDKASLIIPNAEFISGRVKNWMHSNRQKRMTIPISVNHMDDPKRLESLLLDTAKTHRSVLSQPKPMVFFMKITDGSIDFELRCFADVDATATTRSELLFDIYRRLREEGIQTPQAAAPLTINDIETITAAMAVKPEPPADARATSDEADEVPEISSARAKRSAKSS